MPPRPRPLENLVSGRPLAQAYQSLTPRTPHSRAEHKTRGLDDDGDGDLYDDHHPLQQQAEPLLKSSASEHFPPSPRRTTKDDSPVLSLALICHYLPLILGSVLAFLLFALTLLSWKRPEVVDSVLGHQKLVIEAPSPGPPSLTPPINASAYISYKQYNYFPLTGLQYLAECQKMNPGLMKHDSYWKPMPGMHGPQDVWHPDKQDGSCTSSITYQLDGTVGLVADLLLLAQVAALARERNTTFFVDDTYWNRGKWSDHFESVRTLQPGPEPGCKPPLAEELVACPRLVRHWVINSRTAKFHLGHSFREEYEDPSARDLNRLKPIFERAHDSFSTVIFPNAKSRRLIAAARADLSTAGNNGSFVSVHMRRGDQLGSSWAFHLSYPPVSEYASGALDAWVRLAPPASNSPLLVYAASDSPDSVAELKRTLPDTHVHSLAGSGDPQLRELASPEAYVQASFGALAVAERVRRTRGMIIDLALLSGLWGQKAERPMAVVCGISSAVCNAAALGLGWAHGFGLHGGDRPDGSWNETRLRWVEIDRKGDVTPMWEPIRLF